MLRLLGATCNFNSTVLSIRHGLGIVDYNELNSYLNYCSH